MRIGRIVALTITFVSFGACSRAPDAEQRRSESAQTYDVAEAPVPPGIVSPRAPDIAPTAAAGVAFTYHYAFRLPAPRVSAAQEAHAAACEKLGIARCRITGMRYQLIGENDIQGQLAFKLDPALARAFGKQGIAAIEAAEGKLVDAEITGTDAGAAIEQLDRGKARSVDELTRIDAQLARKGLSAGERAELQRQRADARTSIDAARDSAADQRESLANTPMVFDYASGPAVRGFDASAPMMSAVNAAIGSARTTLALALGFVAIFGPPAILALLLWLLWRRLRPLLPRRTPAAPAMDRPEATLTGA